MTIDQINFLLSILALLGQLFIVFLLFYLIFLRKNQLGLNKILLKSAIPISFLVVFLATSGSLYYSEIAKFIPCDLCWFQRIFIYPQVILLGLAWIKKENRITDYSLILIIIGTLISLYHNYIYYSATPSNVCSIVAPCTQQYVVGFTYITIPLLALITFVLTGLLLLSKKILKA